MRAGSLDRTITIERPTTDVDYRGTPTRTWTPVATMRAQLLQNAVDNQDGTRGKTTDAVMTFRSRFLDGVSLEDRVTYQGQQYEITGIKELGRRRGLDLTCVRIGR